MSSPPLPTGKMEKLGSFNLNKARKKNIKRGKDERINNKFRCVLVVVSAQVFPLFPRQQTKKTEKKMFKTGCVTVSRNFTAACPGTQQGNLHSTSLQATFHIFYSLIPIKFLKEMGGRIKRKAVPETGVGWWDGGGG